MKIMIVLGTLYLGLSLCRIEAQVQNPLRDYYSRNFGKVDFATTPDPESPSAPLTPQTRVYSFRADFTGDGRKSVFITTDGDKLGPHGNYSWSLYCPVASGGYRLVSDDSHFIDAGIEGPSYIGYIEQIKRFGAVTALAGGKYGVSVQYLNNGTIQSQSLDEERDHANAEHYPKYFPDKGNNYEITTYTLAQLAKKYAGQ